MTEVGEARAAQKTAGKEQVMTANEADGEKSTTNRNQLVLGLTEPEWQKLVEVGLASLCVKTLYNSLFLMLLFSALCLRQCTIFFK